MKSIIEAWGNEQKWCFFCRKVTDTVEFDCVVCGYSKPLSTSDCEQEKC